MKDLASHPRESIRDLLLEFLGFEYSMVFSWSIVRLMPNFLFFETALPFFLDMMYKQNSVA